MNVFSPRSDPEAGPESFLPHHPHVAMKKGKFKLKKIFLKHFQKKISLLSNYQMTKN